MHSKGLLNDVILACWQREKKSHSNALTCIHLALQREHFQDCIETLKCKTYYSLN